MRWILLIHPKHLLNDCHVPGAVFIKIEGYRNAKICQSSSKDRVKHWSEYREVSEETAHGS